MMKSFKVRIALTNSQIVQTVVQARNQSDAKKIIQGQYGPSLKMIYELVEQR